MSLKKYSKPPKINRFKKITFLIILFAIFNIFFFSFFFSYASTLETSKYLIGISVLGNFLFSYLLYRLNDRYIRQFDQYQEQESHTFYQIYSSQQEAISLLLSGIAHDLNNLITSIMGNLSIIIEDVDHNSEIYESLEIAVKASQKAGAITNQLFNFSKGGHPIIQNVSIETLIADTVRLLLTGSNIKVEYNFGDNLPQIEIDPVQISQVIQNIIINAKQAMADHGRLTISLEVCISNQIPFLINHSENDGNFNSDSYLHASFRDTGPGIPTEIQSKIFTPYFTTKIDGNGLGLYSSMMILQRHHGILDFTSEEGEGTIFHLYLPLSHEKET